MTELHPTAARVRDAAVDLGLDITVVERTESTRTAQEAADAVGCEVGQIVKSLVTLVDDEPVLALVAGDNRLDTSALVNELGGLSSGRADADRVRATTGFAIGGIPPLGHASPLTTVMDDTLLRHDIVWAAAGTPNHVFSVAPDRLAEVVGAIVATIAES